MQIITEAALAAALEYNEAEIRFHIVNPIIQYLGYPGSDDVYLFLEEKLEYPYIHIGRRSKKDQPLGFADYRAGVKGARGSFVVEAKAGSIPLTEKDVEQGHSYAAHAQVGANYFVLCNGSIISVYETLSGPRAAPIVKLNLSEVNARFHEIENILSPHNLVRNCCVVYDRKLKLAPGLGSSVRIRSGKYLLADYETRFIMNGQDVTARVRQSVPQVAEMDRQLDLLRTSFEMRVSDGRVERGDDGKIVAQIKFAGATIHNQQAMTILGIDEVSFSSAGQFISTDPDNPTICESLTDFTVARGTILPLLLGGSSQMGGELLGNMFIKVAIYFADGKLWGQYISLSDQRIHIPGVMPLSVELDFSGTLELSLDL